MVAFNRLSCRCPRCGLDLLDSRRGEWTLAQRILKFDAAGNATARCDRCTTDVPVPWLRVVAPPEPPAEPPRRLRPGVRAVVRVDKLPGA